MREASCQPNVQLDIMLLTKKTARPVLQASIVGQYQTTLQTGLLAIVRTKKGISAEVEVGLPTLK